MYPFESRGFLTPDPLRALRLRGAGSLLVGAGRAGEERVCASSDGDGFVVVLGGGELGEPGDHEWDGSAAQPIGITPDSMTRRRSGSK